MGCRLSQSVPDICRYIANRYKNSEWCRNLTNSHTDSVGGQQAYSEYHSLTQVGKCWRRANDSYYYFLLFDCGLNLPVLLLYVHLHRAIILLNRCDSIVRWITIGAHCLPRDTYPYYECVCPPMVTGQYCTEKTAISSLTECTQRCVTGHCAVANHDVSLVKTRKNFALHFPINWSCQRNGFHINKQLLELHAINTINVLSAY